MLNEAQKCYLPDHGLHVMEFISYTLLPQLITLVHHSGRHAWILSVVNIAAASYIPVQVFEHMHNQQFRAVHCSYQHLRTK